MEAGAVAEAEAEAEAETLAGAAAAMGGGSFTPLPLATAGLCLCLRACRATARDDAERGGDGGCLLPPVLPAGAVAGGPTAWTETV